MADHNYTIHTITLDGEFVSEDTDFREEDHYNEYEETIRRADGGEVVQLIDGELIETEQIVHDVDGY